MTGAGTPLFDAIAMHAEDSVATVICSVKTGARLRVQIGGTVEDIIVTDAIPLCHKVALKVIGKGETVLKNGQIIGRATKPIQVGSHVHIHNLVGRDPADCL